MGKNPNLDSLDDFFANGQDFQLSDKTYEERTGVALPKARSYIINGSALARRAAEHGFVISDVRETPVIVKTVYFKKEGK